MKFADFSQANDVLQAAPGTEHYVQDLTIFRQQPYLISCVEFEPEEVRHILASTQVYLQLLGGPDATSQDYGRALLRFAFAGSFELAQAAESASLTEFEGANTLPMLFVQPLPGQHLPADSQPCAVACFALTSADLDALSQTGRLFLKTQGVTHAPICVHASNPITFSAPVAAEA